MTETMFERMAKAIALSDGYSLEQLNQYRDDPRVCPMPEYRSNVRAVLQAIREPDEAFYMRPGIGEDHLEDWKNAIDSILSQSQEGKHP
jgi:hypothetical protein